MKCYAQTAPFRNNRYLLFGKARRQMAKLSNGNFLLQAHGLCHRQNFVDKYSRYANNEFLCNLLEVDAFPRPTSSTLFMNQFIPQLNLHHSHNSAMYGPMFPNLIEAARHRWREQIFRTPPTKCTIPSHEKQRPKIPLSQLDIADFTPTEDMWNYEICWDRHILPAAADTKFGI
ncbi:hypothetical protein PsorP6_006408 [Peronosclerospora sorghi]|uniref:Uncharacterized protein n=1 Tax=Peronosclerospora sorghi TaxID=230839 RepID=A0ACC0W792_9STRA|nr:hypothetical protein PsorP6_006408 [Peronosclerospora sorghi]